MSIDKRTVATDALETLGMIIDQHQKRDAIHLAVEPVEAGMELEPGQHVGITQGKAFSVHPDMPAALGIVDPFLTCAVRKGQRFWLVVYPRQIQSLRHVWTHPAFPEEPALSHVEQSDQKWSKEDSERWLRDFIASADCPDYDTVIAAASGAQVPGVPGYGEAYENDGEYLLFNGRDAHSEIPPQFWTHVSIVTGKAIPQNMRAKHFTCTC